MIERETDVAGLVPAHGPDGFAGGQKVQQPGALVISLGQSNPRFADVRIRRLRCLCQGKRRISHGQRRRFQSPLQRPHGVLIGDATRQLTNGSRVPQFSSWIQTGGGRC